MVLPLVAVMSAIENLGRTARQVVTPFFIRGSFCQVLPASVLVSSCWIVSRDTGSVASSNAARSSAAACVKSPRRRELRPGRHELPGTGREGDGFSIGLDAKIQLSLIDQCLCEVSAGIGKTGPQPDRLAIFGNRPIKLTLLEQCITQVIVKLWVGGNPLPRVGIRGRRFVEPPCIKRKSPR